MPAGQRSIEIKSDSSLLIQWPWKLTTPSQPSPPGALYQSTNRRRLRTAKPESNTRTKRSQVFDET